MERQSETHRNVRHSPFVQITLLFRGECVCIEINLKRDINSTFLVFLFIFCSFILSLLLWFGMVRQFCYDNGMAQAETIVARARIERKFSRCTAFMGRRGPVRIHVERCVHCAFYLLCVLVQFCDYFLVGPCVFCSYIICRLSNSSKWLTRKRQPTQCIQCFKYCTAQPIEKVSLFRGMWLSSAVEPFNWVSLHLYSLH